PSSRASSSCRSASSTRTWPSAGEVSRLSSAEGPPVDAASAEEAAPASDPIRDELLEALRTALGDAVVGSEINRGDLWVRVRADAVDGAVNGAVDGVVDGVVSGVAGGDTRFQVFARFYSTTRHVGLTLKADLDDDAPTVESIHTVFRGADWHERETWEMYGFTFIGHPDLTHLYLPGEFEGFPLRKDYPLLAREVKPWPGLVDVELMPGEPAAAEGEAEGA